MNQCTCPQAITQSETLKQQLHPELKLFPYLRAGYNQPIFEIKKDDD